MTWPDDPLIYEINTWVWLNELSRKYGRQVTLASVPGEQWDEIAELGFDAVWLMGVWERSPAGVVIARQEEGLQPEYRRALPDYSPEDVVGSPYCIHRYVADQNLGGDRALAVARAALAGRKLRLILDFVPNHVAPDHPWLLEHLEYFVRGGAGDLIEEPRAFFEYGGRVFACGRDPYFAPWRDTAQINAFNPALRRAYVELLSGIAAACDGVRCDMAMLLINDVFERTWGQRAGPPPPTELWQDLIPAVKSGHPDFLFIAEAYWDREWQLQQFGFDYCYDKRLYDRLVHDNTESVRLHLLADISYQKKLVRFLENHDEPRAAAVFSEPKECAAAVAIITLPGARLIHEGQLEGRRVKLPIQLCRRPDEPVNTDLRDFYHRLLKFVAEERMAEGDWQLCERTGWAGNTSYLNVLAWCVRSGRRRRLTVVNLSDSPAQARIRLPWDDLGLFVDLGAWGYRVLSTRAVLSSQG